MQKLNGFFALKFIVSFKVLKGKICFPPSYNISAVPLQLEVFYQGVYLLKKNCVLESSLGIMLIFVISGKISHDLVSCY